MGYSYYRGKSWKFLEKSLDGKISGELDLFNQRSQGRKAGEL